uniref:AAA+ ATPase domain-containing protein n=1 Tax=Noctiluca scintillans TaxID=2966 RepID=A0A7S1FIN7_NOCSC|mmetsp:Transcript_64035/g.169600  ORF Transcript_64035/g.169600 Transcript_64035/m.169600 type:complete len:1331 (+) Transcript_64035:80-4072(+)
MVAAGAKSRFGSAWKSFGGAKQPEAGTIVLDEIKNEATRERVKQQRVKISHARYRLSRALDDQILEAALDAAEEVQAFDEKLSNDLLVRLLELSCDLPGTDRFSRAMLVCIAGDATFNEHQFAGIVGRLMSRDAPHAQVRCALNLGLPPDAESLPLVPQEVEKEKDAQSCFVGAEHIDFGELSDEDDLQEEGAPPRKLELSGMTVNDKLNGLFARTPAQPEILNNKRPVYTRKEGRDVVWLYYFESNGEDPDWPSGWYMGNEVGGGGRTFARIETTGELPPSAAMWEVQQKEIWKQDFGSFTVPSSAQASNAIIVDDEAAKLHLERIDLQKLVGRLKGRDPETSKYFGHFFCLLHLEHLAEVFSFRYRFRNRTSDELCSFGLCFVGLDLEKTWSTSEESKRMPIPGWKSAGSQKVGLKLPRSIDPDRCRFKKGESVLISTGHPLKSAIGEGSVTDFDIEGRSMVVNMNGHMPTGCRKKLRIRTDLYANRTSFERQVTALMQFVTMERTRICDMLIAAGVGKVDLAVLGGDGFHGDKDKLGGSTQEPDKKKRKTDDTELEEKPVAEDAILDSVKDEGVSKDAALDEEDDWRENDDEPLVAKSPEKEVEEPMGFTSMDMFSFNEPDEDEQGERQSPCSLGSPVDCKAETLDAVCGDVPASPFSPRGSECPDKSDSEVSEDGPKVTDVDLRAAMQEWDDFEADPSVKLDPKEVALKPTDAATAPESKPELDDGLDADARKALEVKGKTLALADEIVEGVLPVRLAEAENEIDALGSVSSAQRSAILNSMSKRLTIVQGPPGTGKTHTSIRILTLWAKTMKYKPLLATSECNIAVDNIAEGLVKNGVKVVRIGRPEKVREHLEKACLDNMVRIERENRRKRQLEDGENEELEELGEEPEDEQGKDYENWLRRRALRHRQQSWERKEDAWMRAQFLADAEVICSTTITAGSQALSSFKFHGILIDEVAQATEASSIVPIVCRGAKQLVLCGDHCQLPPSVVSREAELRGFSLSLYSRLVEAGVPFRFLDTQYRAHPMLMEFSASCIYQGKLKNGIDGSLRPQPKGVPWPNPECPAAFFEVDVEEHLDGESKANIAEARVLLELVKKVLDYGELKMEDIGIVTPYKGQVRTLRKVIFAGIPEAEKSRELEIASVDNFQGREKELIVFSAVRCNDFGGVGFLADWRRLNVMITRARRGLVIIGNAATLACDPHWKLWLQFTENQGGSPKGTLERALEAAAQKGKGKGKGKRKKKLAEEGSFALGREAVRQPLKKKKGDKGEESATKKPKRDKENKLEKKSKKQGWAQAAWGAQAAWDWDDSWDAAAWGGHVAKKKKF